jgi:hypothetical protein
MTRAAAALPLALAVAGCASPSGAVSACGHEDPAQPLLVLERGDQTAALARLAGGCFTETGVDPILGSDQNLLAAHGKPFVGVNDTGTLLAMNASTLQIAQTFSVYPDHPPSAVAHGIYGVDVDAATENLWVSRDDVPEIAVIAPGGALVEAVDLTSLDPVVKAPYMNGILLEGGRAYVALGFLPPPPHLSDDARRVGMIAILDVASRAIVGHIDLVGHNPVHDLIPIDSTGQKIIVATPGQHDAIDAGDGIDLVDLTAGTATQLISETALGGSVDEVVWGGPTEAYAIVLGPQDAINPTSVVAFNPQTGKVRTLAKAPWFTDPQNGQGYVHVGLALDGDMLVVGDHDQDAPAILVFSRATGEQLAPIPATVEAPWGALTVSP